MPQNQRSVTGEGFYYPLKCRFLHFSDRLLDFALFLKARWTEKGASKATPQESTKLILHTLPASHLDRLTGLVSWGGDAVADAERLYDDHS